MVRLQGFDPRRYPPGVLAVAGSIALALFIASTMVEVRIVVERPGFGDVTTEVLTLWRVAMGVATLGSFLLAIHNVLVAQPRGGSPSSGLEIGGRNHDIDVHIYPDSATADADGFSGSRDDQTRDDAEGGENSAGKGGDSATGTAGE